MRPTILLCITALLTTLALPLRVQADECEDARCRLQSDINSACPCDNQRFTNHGRYMSCVAHVVNRLARSGQIPTTCKGKLKRCAARSTCGKVGRVTCQVPVLGTCDTTVGTCTNDRTHSCTLDTDCTLSRCKIFGSADGCTIAGGTVGPGGTCCSSCAVAPTPVP